MNLPTQPRRWLGSLAVLVVLAVLGVGMVRSWATGGGVYGITGSSGTSSFTIDPVSYDVSSGAVSGTARFANANGIHALNPGGTFKILLLNPATKAISEDTGVTCVPTLSGNQVSWDFAYTVPTGYVFFGVGVTGTYVNSTGQTMALDSTGGGYADTDQFP